MGSQDHQIVEQNDADSQVPNTEQGQANVEVQEDAKQQVAFSWKRVAIVLAVAIVLVVPGLFYMESQGWVGKGRHANGREGLSLAQVGSGRRGGPAFDYSRLTVPENEIRAGGPPKDGIPALSDPKFISPQEASYLNADDRVIGVVSGQDARAYPLKILNYHEIVNDTIKDIPIAVTYCPLCDSADVFDRRTELGVREFGVSGLLYNSNVLMYDRSNQTESLWSQIKAEGISGPGAKKSLRSLPLELTTWSDWVSRYPQTKVLSAQTGHNRNYTRSPYGGYFSSPQLMFPVRPTSDRLPTKERVLGVWTKDAARAYPISAFSKQRRRVEEQLGGKRFVIEFVPDAATLRVVEAEEGLQWMYSLWFAWYAFHPDTEVFE